MAEDHRFSLATDMQVRCFDPQQPWQRGSNVNTNGLLRQYLPKWMVLSNVHQDGLIAVDRRSTERPRGNLDFETPAKRSSQRVASIG
jgi:IS30 family transposase